MHRNIEKVDIDTPYYSPENKRPRYRVVVTVFTDDPIGMQSLINGRCEAEMAAADSTAMNTMAT